MSKQYSIMTMGKDGPLLGMSVEGIEEVQAELDSLADKLKEETSLQMVMDVGSAVAEWMKENVRKNFTKHPTGTLEASITAITLTNDDGAVCFVGPNMAAIPYALIHEFGGDIYPVRRKFLSWIGDDGKRVFSKHVRIPARPYMAPAYDEHAEEIKDIMMEDFYGAVTAGCADL